MQFLYFFIKKAKLLSEKKLLKKIKQSGALVATLLTEREKKKTKLPLAVLTYPILVITFKFVPF